MIPRIFADFNSRIFDQRGERIYIGKEGSWQIDQYPLKSCLEPGAAVRLYDGELQVDAVLEFDEQNRAWFGKPDWATRRDLRSRADGLEDYKHASSDQKLAMLRYEMDVLITVVQGYADLLKEIDPNAVSGLPEHFSRLAGDIGRTADDLKEILNILTDGVHPEIP